MHHNRLHRLSTLESNWKRCSILIFSESSVCLIHPFPRVRWKMFELVALGLDSALCHLDVNVGRQPWRPCSFYGVRESRSQPQVQTKCIGMSVAGLDFRKTIFVTAGFSDFMGWALCIRVVMWIPGIYCMKYGEERYFVIKKSNWDLYNLCLIPNPAVDCCSALG